MTSSTCDGSGNEGSRKGGVEEQKSDIHITFRMSARIPWVGAGTPLAEAPKRVQHRPKKSARISDKLCMCCFCSSKEEGLAQGCNTGIDDKTPIDQAIGPR